jgi:hypothetical protein
VVRARARQLDLLERGDQRLGLGRPDPDRQAPLAADLLEHDDVTLGAVGRAAHVGDGHGDGGGHGELLSVDVDELAAQRAASLVQACLDRARPGAEAPRHLGVAEAAQMEERDGGPLTGRQRGDGRPHTRGDLRGLGGLVRAGARRRRLAAVGASPARSLLQRAPAQVEADPDQPRPEAIGLAQPVEPDQGGHHRLLRRVGRQLGVAGRPAACGQQHAVVALDEHAERTPLAATGGGHQLGVGSVATGHDGTSS